MAGRQRCGQHSRPVRRRAALRRAAPLRPRELLRTVAAGFGANPATPADAQTTTHTTLGALNSPARRRRLTAGPTPAARTPESEQRGEQGRDSGVRIPEAALPEAQDAASQRGTPARAASRPVRPPHPTPHLPHQHTHLAQVPPLVQGASPLVVLLPGSARGSAAGAALAVQPPDLGAHLARRGVKVDGWAAGQTPGRATALLPARQATNPSVLHACPQSRAG